MSFGGNPINWRDLFDFSDNKDIRDAVKDLEKLTKAYEEFSKNVTNGSLDHFSQLQKEIADSVRELVNASKDLNITQKEGQKILLSNAQQLQSYDAMLQKLLETKKKVKETDTVVEDSVNGLTQKLKEQLTEYNNLSKAEALNSESGKQLAKDIAITRGEIKLLTDATKANTNTFVAAKGSYDELDRQTKQLVKDLRALEGGMNSNNKEANLMKAQILDNTKRLKEFDAQIGQNFRNVGNYSSAFSGLSNELQSFGAGLITITALTQGFASAFNKSLAFNAILQGLSFVSKNAQEAEENLAFLRKTAQDLGLDFTTLANSFKNFSVATKDTNLEGKYTKDIFLAVSKAASVLHLSTDSVNHIFLALEQIVSKGTLSMEELRRQLGNNLPGAFQLFAKGLNLSTKELNDFIKKGEITKDSLVPFAEQLEKTFGKGTEAATNTLQASVNKLGNTFDSFFQKKGLQDFFKGFIDIGNAALTLIKDQFTPAFVKSTQAFEDSTAAIIKNENAISPLLSRYDELKGKAKLSADEQTELKQTINELAAIVPGAATEFDKYGQALDINKQKVIDFTEANRKLNESFQKTAVRDLQKDINDNLKKATFAQQDLRGDATNNPAYNPDGSFTLLGKKKFADLQQAREDILKDAREIVRIGGQLDQTTLAFIGQYSSVELQKYKDIQDLSAKIQAADLRAYQALKAGKDKERADIIKEIEGLKKQRQELVSPGSTATGELNIYQSGDDKESARKKAIKASRDLFEATEKYQIELAKSSYEKTGLRTTEAQKALENKLYEIKIDSYEKQQALYAKGTKEYTELEAKKVAAANDRIKAIDKLTEEQIARDKKQQDDRERTLKERKKAQQGVDSANAETQFIGDSATIDLKLAAQKGGLFTGRNDEFAAFEAHYQLQQRALAATIKLRQEDLADLKAHLGEVADLDKDYLDKKKQLIDAENQLKENSANFGVAQAQREADAKQAAYKAAYDFAVTAVNAYTDLLKNNSDVDIATITHQKEKEIELAGNNATAKAKIESEYNNKLKAARRKQSQNEKDAAVFSILANTAVAAGRAFADYQYPYSLIIAALAAASAGAQLASIQSKKVPEYWKGRENGPEEWAFINERGTEVIEEKSGRMYIAAGGKKGLHKLSEGDKVYTHEESSKMISKMEDVHDINSIIDSLLIGTNVYRQANENNTDRLVNALAHTQISESGLQRAFSKAIENIVIEQNNFDESGYNRYRTRKGQRAQDLSNRNKFGGRG